MEVENGRIALIGKLISNIPWLLERWWTWTVDNDGEMNLSSKKYKYIFYTRQCFEQVTHQQVMEDDFVKIPR